MANGQLSEPQGVAVNEATGDVYVADTGNNRVQYFTASGTYIGQFNGSGTSPGEEGAAPTGRFNHPDAIAIDNTSSASDPSGGDVYVLDHYNKVIDKFTAAGAYVGQLVETGAGEPFTELYGISVDVTGNVWVLGERFGSPALAKFNDAVHNEYEPQGSLMPFSSPSPRFALAVDAQRSYFYYIDNGPFAEKHELGTGALITRELDSAYASGVAVEPGTGNVVVYNWSPARLTMLSADGATLEQGLGEGHLLTTQERAGVAVDEATGTIYVADNAGDVVDRFPLEPPAPPTVESESVASVGSSAAELAAYVHVHGEAVAYRFEYGSCRSLSECSTSEYQPIAGGSLGAAFESYEVSAELSGLTPLTAYHFRIAVSSAGGSSYGPEQTFVTQEGGSSMVLPDGRAWELVSPVDKHGAAIKPIELGGSLVQASADGDAITYDTDLPTETSASGNVEAVQVLSQRSSSGWSSRDMSLPHSRETGITTEQDKEYHFFSEDLSQAVVEPSDPFIMLSTMATERTPYVRRQSLCENGEGPQTACFLPLVTAQNVPAGTAFGGDPATERAAVTFAGATPSARSVVVQSAVALTSTSVNADALYLWSDGKSPTEELAMVSWLPNGAPAYSASLGSFGPSGDNARHAISNDGSRVVWSGTVVQGSHDKLYLRDVAADQTVELDAEQPGAPGGEPSASFQTADTTATKIFFSDQYDRLTPEAGENDLYECEIVDEAEKLTCRLTDLIPGGHMEGMVLGASEDGTHLYFVATGDLSTNENAVKEKARAGAYNLYELDHGSAGWEPARFIATLSQEDQEDWAPNGATFGGGLSRLTARVSPDGLYVAFMSNRSLTGYDNRDVNSGRPDEEVYLYKAPSDGEEARLVCASCNPSGGRPVGRESVNFGGVVDDVNREVHPWLAANIPGWTPWQDNNALHQARYLSDSGRLFFNSFDSLVPQDSNGDADVYEYEPVGVGGCARTSKAFSERTDACVGLISSGIATSESGLVDASENGDDVFFLTAAKLTAQDVDTAYDIYDAHVCATESPCTIVPASPAPCDSPQSCRSNMASPESLGSPPPPVLIGPGNSVPPHRSRQLTRAQKLTRALKICRKKKGRRRRRACARRARRLYGFETSPSANAKKGKR